MGSATAHPTLQIHASNKSPQLGLVCSQTQLCHIGLFVDLVEQLYVSVFVGHRQVVLREIR